MKKITQDSIQQILDSQSRTPRPDIALSWKMAVLLQSFNDPLKHQTELLKYYPISVVAAIQGYFRSRLADLIDHGEPFLSNAILFNPQIKVDVSMAGAIASGKLTFGQMLMHSVSINSFEELVSVLSLISGQKDILRQISQATYPSLAQIKRGKIMSAPDEAWRLLGQVFETRHILSHELATDLELDKEETRRLLLMAQEFMQAAAEWIAHTINPLSPEEREKQWMQEVAAVKSKAKRLLENVRKEFKGAGEMEECSRLFGETYESITQLASIVRKSGMVHGLSLYGLQARLIEMYLLRGLIAGMSELGRIPNPARRKRTTGRFDASSASDDD